MQKAGDIRVNWAERLPTGACVLVGEHFTPLDDQLVRKLPGEILIAGSPAYLSPGPGVLTADVTAAQQQLKDRLKAGGRVCVLLDAHLDKGGDIPGLQAALALGAPVVPICFDGPWSNRYKAGVENYRLPRKGLPVSLSIGRPTDAAGFREALLSLEAEVWMDRKRDLQPLSYSIVSRLRENPDSIAMTDAIRGPISRIRTLTGAVAIARAMKRHWGDQQRVGLLLPPSIGGALANMAAILQGRSVVNLNYTTGRAGMENAIKQAGLKTVLASKQFLHKGKIEAPTNAQVIYLEDVARAIGGFAKFKALLAAKYLPYRRLLKFAGATREAGMDDDHAIIFSSGSTGEPKGIPVSHFNIISNIEQAARVLDLDSHDSLMHMLPFFHTFGDLLLFAGLHWGASMVFLPNPLDVEAVGKMTQEHKATILVATPTFLQMYAKKCTPEQFASLRIVVAGAEKLPQPLAVKWREKFGVPISEGYGCTECSPVIAVNVPDYKGQVGSLPGSVGRPLPGLQLRITDPDSGELCPLGTPGLLQVKGPNVMRGYLDQPEKTAAVLKDGWYTTGDIVKQDANGFITITDRLSRFSKIGGEMVPHGRVEEALHLAIKATEQVFAVTSIRDDKKGERLAVLHCNCTHEIEIVVKELQGAGLPNIFIPKPRDFVPVEALPVLGTGKMDLRAMKRIAEERLNQSPAC
jgi:acyl-[acyl-carrier-protein]-phospholipid O-acyltransferase/long-chain-fatty-acid--[acyl-carrier-protein] ligase